MKHIGQQAVAKIATVFGLALTGCSPTPAPDPEMFRSPLDRREFMVRRDGTQIVPCIIETDNDPRGKLFNKCAMTLRVPVFEFVGKGTPNVLVYIVQPGQYFHTSNPEAFTNSFHQCDRIRQECRLTN